MAKGSSPAKRTNTGLALLLITALLGAGATALFGDTSPDIQRRDHDDFGESSAILVVA